MTKKNDKAPIILFVYNRPEHTKKVIEALKSNKDAKDSILYVYSDASKDEKSSDEVYKVRSYIKNIDGFKEIIIIEREKNWGIEKSEIDAITNVINEHGKAIMVEDDVVVSHCFLSFVNDSLIKYENEKKVISVTGYSFIKNKNAKKLDNYAFTSLASVWGWATWRDRWNLFSPKLDRNDIKKLCNTKYRELFDYGYCYSEMLYNQYVDNYITWDIAWYWTSFVNNKLTLFPTTSMVNNIGMDGTGIHYTNRECKNRIEDIEGKEYNGNLPDVIEEKKEIKKIIRKSLNDIALGSSIFLVPVFKSIIKYMKWEIRKQKF